MSLAVVMAFEILAALALGFVIGRIWQLRRDELDRRNFKVPPRAHSAPSKPTVGLRIGSSGPGIVDE
jgi:hypothetical protein